MKFNLLFVLTLIDIGTQAAPLPALQNGALLPGIIIIDDMERHRKNPATISNKIPVQAVKQTNDPDVLIIDNMNSFQPQQCIKEAPLFLKNPSDGEQEGPEQTNSLGGREGPYRQAPSWAESVKSEGYGKIGSGLKIVYDKKNRGGPHNDGGFCGYYTVLHGFVGEYLDASRYQYLTFWVKGAKGNEKFKVGAADKTWAQADDSLKSKEVGSYLPAGKITTDWQQAVIPLSEFSIDWKLAHAISFCFEADLFPNGAGQGTIFIDELVFMKNKPAQTPE